MKIIGAILIIVIIMVYIYYDVSHIYNKNLVKSNLVSITIKKKTFYIDAMSIKKIINDKKYKWIPTIATYRYDIFIESKSDNINFRFMEEDKPYLIVNYLHKNFGYVQIISKTPIVELKKIINEVQ
jgi:hypothetical protein